MNRRKNKNISIKIILPIDFLLKILHTVVVIKKIVCMT